MNTAVASASSATQQHLFDDVKLAQNGDHQAFARLITHTRQLVSSIALSIVKDLDNSEDVAQQVYIGAWQNISELKSSSSFLPWLRQMTRYKAFNFLRDNKIRQKVQGDEADLILAQFCDPKVALDQKMVRDQSNLILQNFIGRLPAESREIVLLYYREEQSSQQVARLLEQSETNIRKKLSRVRQLLHKQILAKHGRLLLSTAPALGFSSLVLAAITTSSPVAAAAISSAAASSKTGIMHKVGMLLGGSMLGALMAILAVRFSTAAMLKTVSNDQARQQILRYRATMTLWLIFSGILLTLGYELTQGWWGPVSAYVLFACGVTYQVHKVQKLVEREVYGQSAAPQQQIDPRMWQKMCGRWANIFGVLVGFICLIIGLLASGRLIL